MQVRDDFPILRNNPDLVYLDSACTSLKPDAVIEAEAGYYRELGACGGRSSHALGRKTSDAIEEARENVSRFVGATAGQLIWTRNTTEALNMVAKGLDYSKRRKVVTSVMEHHAILLPLMHLRDGGKIELDILGADGSGQVSRDSWERAIDRNTALVMTSSWNNTTGGGNDAKELGKLCSDNGALLCLDGAQGVPHHSTDFARSGADFLCFSGHKMLGPTGIGCLVAGKGRMENLGPILHGGGTVKTVSIVKAAPMEGHARFEAGVQDYAGIIGLSAACDYLKKIGMDKVEGHERALARALLAELEQTGATIYGRKNPEGHGALYSFGMKGARPHELALLLDKDGIAVRSGYFCAQPAMEAVGAGAGAVRASAYIYNTVEEVRKFGSSLRRLSALFM